MAEVEMDRQYHQLNEREFEQTLKDSQGQGRAAAHGVAKSQTPLKD